MSSIIYVYDERVLVCFNWNKEKFAAKPGEESYPVIKVTEQMWISEIVEKILEKSSPGEIDTLKIMAHGSKEFPKIFLGKEGIKSTTVYKFKKLDGRFSKKGKIELHACGVLNEKDSSVKPGKTIPQQIFGGKDPNDDILIKKSTDPFTGLIVKAADWCQQLADFTNAEVIATEQRQIADKEWSFEGPTKTFRPVLTTMQEKYDQYTPGGVSGVAGSVDASGSGSVGSR